MHFYNHLWFYFLLAFNFFVVRYFKYKYDNKNFALKNFKDTEVTRTVLDSSKTITSDTDRTEVYLDARKRGELWIISLVMRVLVKI